MMIIFKFVHCWPSQCQDLFQWSVSHASFVWFYIAAWYSMVWYVMVWCGMVWYDTVLSTLSMPVSPSMERLPCKFSRNIEEVVSLASVSRRQTPTQRCSMVSYVLCCMVWYDVYVLVCFGIWCIVIWLYCMVWYSRIPLGNFPNLLLRIWLLEWYGKVWYGTTMVLTSCMIW